jgi:hypothetical protein
VPPPARPVAPPAPATPKPQGPSIVRPIYETKDEAFEGALNEALAESLHSAEQHGRHVEYSGAVFRIGHGEHAGKYSYTPAVKGGFKHAPVVNAPENTERVALYHSHPQEGEDVEFSLPDVVEAFLAGVPIIVVGKPTEAPPIMKQYDPPKELPIGISIDPITNRVTVENVPDYVAPEAHALKRFLSAGTERVLR